MVPLQRCLPYKTHRPLGPSRLKHHNAHDEREDTKEKAQSSLLEAYDRRKS